MPANIMELPERLQEQHARTREEAFRAYVLRVRLSSRLARAPP